MLDDRRSEILLNLPLRSPGLEIAPFFSPVVERASGYPVHYTDCIGTEEIQHKARSHGDVVAPAIDFIWTPGKPLSECAPAGVRYSYAIASHVIEHVPDTLGWLREVFSVMEDGARLSLVIPDRRKTMDHYRQETKPGDLIDAWFRGLTKPSPGHIFDYLSRCVDDQATPGTRSFDVGAPFHEAPRYYTDTKALEFAIHAWSSDLYLDMHCTVWTPDSFVHAMVMATQMGILNAHIEQPVEREIEFMIQLVKQGEPGRDRPLSSGRSDPVLEPQQACVG